MKCARGCSVEVVHADQHLVVTPEGDGWLCDEPPLGRLCGKSGRMDAKTRAAIEADKLVAGRGFARLRNGVIEHIPASEVIIFCGDVDESALPAPIIPQQWPVIGPTPMYLTCPKCNARHIDEGEFATKAHHTHSCQSCGLTWRPAVGPTVGVAFLPGFKNP